MVLMMGDSLPPAVDYSHFCRRAYRCRGGCPPETAPKAEDNAIVGALVDLRSSFLSIAMQI
jgi:hypothetical protein